MKRLILLGASGHGKVIADIAAQNGYTEIIFLDDDPLVKECAGYPVIGPISQVDEMEGDIIVAIGNPIIRRKITERIKNRTFPVLIHPKAVVASNAVIGAGSVIMAGAVINPGAVIGKSCIVNTCSSVDHDCVLGDYCHISVGAHLCGTVNVGDNTWIGAGSVIKNNISICGDCMIGAGAVVVEDIKAAGTYIGVPARLMRRNV